MDEKFPNLIVWKTQFMPATYSWELTQQWLNFEGWKGMPLLHIPMLFVFLVFAFFPDWTILKDRAASFCKIWPVQWCSWLNLIFLEIQSPTSNAFLKLHCKLHPRARKTRWQGFPITGLLHCAIDWRTRGSTIFVTSLWMYRVQPAVNALWPYCQFIPTINESLPQYKKNL